MRLLLYLGCPTGERAALDLLLRSAGFAVRWIDDAADALAVLDERIMPILVDLRSTHAIPTIKELGSRRPGAIVVAVEDPGRPGTGERARSAGVMEMLDRPIDPQRLVSALRERPQVAPDPSDDRTDLEGVVACSPAMKHVVASVRAASADPTGAVLLSGEPGVGRRFMARALHDLDRQPGGRLVELDCAAHPVDLETALFGTTVDTDAKAAAGHALTFASSGSRASTERITRASLACEAIGGTLLLLNVADMPARVQGRLVRLLRDCEAALPGGGCVRGPIRAVACVDPGFDAMVHEGRVRPDLFRRLSTTRIDVPPLRERREDIPALAASFLEHTCRLMQVGPKGLSEPAVTLLTSLPYHGNVRELRTLIVTLAERTEGTTITLEDLLRHLRLDVAGAPVASSFSGTLRSARAHFEQQYIRDVLERHHGRIAEAAKSLGIQRTNLYRKMRTLGVQRRTPGNGNSRNEAH